MEILQTYIFDYLEYDDICSLGKTGSSRLREISEDYITPGMKILMRIWYFLNNCKYIHLCFSLNS